MQRSLVRKVPTFEESCRLPLQVKYFCLENKAVGFEETSAFVYRTAWRHNPEDSRPKVFFSGLINFATNYKRLTIELLT
jgi:hypothetical protein